MKILFYGTQSYDRHSFDKELTDYPDVSIDYTEINLTPLTASLAQGYDAVCAFVNADASIMTLEILAGFGVKLVLMRCAGFDAVNVEAAKDLGIKVTRVPAYSPEAIAEHAMGLGLCANRRIHRGYNRIRENDFSLVGLVGETLHGKTAGIVGTGRIGAALCRICKGFGMTVLGADLYPNQKLVDEEHVVDEYVDYDELWKRSDFISLHAFLNEESYHMINDKTIGQMKDGVILVNTGRGGGDPPQPGDAPQYPREPLLGVLLQCGGNPPGGGGLDPALWYRHRALCNPSAAWPGWRRANTRCPKRRATK